MINLNEIVLPELAFDAQEVATQEQLFNLITDRLIASEFVTERDSLIDGFKKREDLCSTAVGHGIALPHSATDAIKRIVVVVVRLNPGLDWHARDNQPVHLIVALVSPPALYPIYLQALAALARALHISQVREMALNAPTPGDAARIIAQSAQKWEEGEGLIVSVC